MGDSTRTKLVTRELHYMTEKMNCRREARFNNNARIRTLARRVMMTLDDVLETIGKEIEQQGGIWS